MGVEFSPALQNAEQKTIKVMIKYFIFSNSEIYFPAPLEGYLHTAINLTGLERRYHY